MKDTFLEIYTKNIKRPGSDKLLEWLLSTDFFSAPASTRFHGSHEGGLVEHSVNVYNRLYELNTINNYPLETIAICALLHDVCKADFYSIEYRNRKNDETGKWEKYPFYTVNDRLPYGHGEKSVYIISAFMSLSREEAMAIRWHMGGFDASSVGGSPALSAAFEQYPLSLLLHMADLEATYFDEKRSDGQ